MTEANQPYMDEKEELETLASLYEPGAFSFSKESFPFSPIPLYTGWYKFVPRLDSSLTLSYRATKETRQIDSITTSTFIAEGVRHHTHNMEFLPPITIKFILPLGYPDSEIPRFELICSWLPPSKLIRASEMLCDYARACRGDSQLWNCFDYIETSLLTMIELPKSSDGIVFKVNDMFSTERQRGEAVVELLKYQQEQKDRIFNQSVHECEVCLEVGLGRDFTKVRVCGHAFCNQCLRHSLETFMNSNTFNGVLACMSCKQFLDINEIKRFASKHQFSLYDSFLLQRSLSRMQDLVNCPRQGCGHLIWYDDEELAVCTNCQYTFCPRCLRLYHPGNACEKVASIFEEDDATSDESEDNNKKEEDLLWEISHCLDTERRKTLIADLIILLHSTDFTWRSLLVCQEKDFRQCPTCGIFIEKISGCHNMVCRFCGKSFDWERDT